MGARHRIPFLQNLTKTGCISRTIDSRPGPLCGAGLLPCINTLPTLDMCHLACAAVNKLNSLTGNHMMGDPIHNMWHDRTRRGAPTSSPATACCLLARVCHVRRCRQPDHALFAAGPLEAKVAAQTEEIAAHAQQMSAKDAQIAQMQVQLDHSVAAQSAAQLPENSQQYKELQHCIFSNFSSSSSSGTGCPCLNQPDGEST